MKRLGIMWWMCLALAFMLPAGCSDESQDTRSEEAEPPKNLTLDLGNGVTMELVLIPAGKFMMGSKLSPAEAAERFEIEAEYFAEEHPRHEVTISRSFYIGATEVTQEQYQAVMGTNPASFKGRRRPVETVSWNNAAAFCKALSEKVGKVVRLPTEAEWEYACRAGTKGIFSFGDDPANLHKHGNYSDQSHVDESDDWKDTKHNDGHDKTAPAGSFKPNAFGLYDMHGNVWEWCADWYWEDYYRNSTPADPRGPDRGDSRVLRGGSCVARPVSCRAAARHYWDPSDNSTEHCGFRVVVGPAPQSRLVARPVVDKEALRRQEAATTRAASLKLVELTTQPGRRGIWLRRAVEALVGIMDSESRRIAAQNTALALAEIGSYREAEKLVRELITDDDWRPMVLGGIAYTLSANGYIQQAIALVDDQPNIHARERILLHIGMAQSHQGNVNEAVALVPRIKNPEVLDILRGSIAAAQASAGDLAAAKITAAKIRKGHWLQKARQDIERGKVDKGPPLNTIDSHFLRSQLKGLLLFSESGTWSDNALQALIIAKKKNAKELDGWIHKTLTSVEKADQPAPATARLLLCLALAIADRADEARAMAQRFLVAANGDTVGVSGLFGEPVLAYLFTRLGMEKELQKLLITEPGEFPNSAVMQGVGVAEAEAGNWKSLETRYRSLSYGIDRVNLSCGVLAGL